MVPVDCQYNSVGADASGCSAAAVNITVAIPTYNGARRLPAVLDQLQQQQGLETISWEIIVCDNNSCDRTVAVVHGYQQHWAGPAPLRYRFEPRQGAAFARQRAVEEAQGELVAFLDDDNIPATDWLSQVWQFAQQHPEAGAFGSQIHGQFGDSLPKDFDKIACFLAIIERGDRPHLYQPRSKILPPAAGLVVRRRVWLSTVPERLFLNNKGKEAGLASEDLEALLHIQKAGWQIWYNADMVVTHQIPASRLERDYLMALMRCVGLSRFYIRFLGSSPLERIFKLPAYAVNDLRRLLRHWLRHGFSVAKLELAAACERSLLTSTLASPTFLLKKAGQDRWQRWCDRARPRQQGLQHLTEALESDSSLAAITQRLHPVAAASLTRAAPPLAETWLQLQPCQPPTPPANLWPLAQRHGLARTLDRRLLLWTCQLLGPSQVYCLSLSPASAADWQLLSFLEEQKRLYPEVCDRLWLELPGRCIPRLEANSEWLQQLTEMGFGFGLGDIDVADLRWQALPPPRYLKLRWQNGPAWQQRLKRLSQAAAERGTGILITAANGPELTAQLQSLGATWVRDQPLPEPPAGQGPRLLGEKR